MERITDFVYQLDDFALGIIIFSIAILAGILVKLTNIAQDMVRHKYQMGKADNFRERKYRALK